MTLTFDLLTLKVVSQSRANFSLPRPLCSRVRPDVRDRQTDRLQTDGRRQTKASLGAGHNNKTIRSCQEYLCFKLPSNLLSVRSKKLENCEFIRL